MTETVTATDEGLKPGQPITQENVALLRKGDWLSHPEWGAAQFVLAGIEADPFVTGPWIFLGRPGPDGFIPWEGTTQGPIDGLGLTCDFLMADGRIYEAQKQPNFWHLVGGWRPRVPASIPAPVTAEMGDGLKPCPFCGGPAELERDSDHHGSWFNLGCARHWGKPDIQADEACLGARLYYTEDAENEAKAIAAWNRRPTPDLSEVVDFIRSAAQTEVPDRADCRDDDDHRVTVTVMLASLKDRARTLLRKLEGA